MRLSTANILLIAVILAMPLEARIAGKPPATPAPPTNPFIGDSRLPGPGIGRELRDIDKRIDRAQQRGALSRREARQLEREERHIRRLARRYDRDGLSESERSELQARASYLRDAANRAASNSGTRAGRSGR
jgi:hypothetical protein